MKESLLPWWSAGGIVPLPSPVRFEPPPGLRADHGRALRESLQDRVHIQVETSEPEEEQ